jgi:hypothetical protein
MAATVKITVIVGDHGRVLGAELPARDAQTDEKPPASRLIALAQHRSFRLAIPREAAELPGPDLHRYLSELKIRADGEIELPKITIKRARRNEPGEPAEH